MKRFSACLLVALGGVSYSSASIAADLVIDTPSFSQGVVEASTGKWDGPFIGVFGGYLAGTTSAPVAFDLNGYLLGVNVGTNFTLGNGIVAGVVGDIAWSSVTDAEVILPPGAFDENWNGSIRGRVGYDGGAFMPYLTAGLAFSNDTLTASNGVVVGTNTHFGWTAGAGLEIMATDNLSVDLAYRYSDYGAATYGITPWEFSAHQVTAGLNWRF